MKRTLLFSTLWLIASMLSLLQGQKFELRPVATYHTDVFGQGSAETVAFDPASARIFFTNASKNTLTILDAGTPAQPTLFKEVDLSAYGGGVNSVDVHSGLVAVAVENTNKQEPGRVVFFDAAGSYLGDVAVGALPDMLTFTPDGKRILVANEGEPDADYLIDPPGSVSIIDVSAGASGATVSNVSFEAFNSKKAYLQNKGIRIYGPGATVAQDLEPEFVSVTPDGKQAYVSLQENNAIAVIDIDAGAVLDIFPMNYKDHLRGTPRLQQYRLDQLPNWPVLGKPAYNGGQPEIKLGGFSGLYFDPKESDADNYVFYTMPDRGPNEDAVPKANVVSPGLDASFTDLRVFKLPDYQGRIVKLRLNRKTGEVSLDNQIFMRRFNPENNDTLPITGRSNLFGFDEVPAIYSDPNTQYVATDWIDTVKKVSYAELAYDAYGGDFEGIVRDRDGNFWLCDEYRPGLYKFKADGVLIDRYVPAGTAGLVSDIVPLPPGFFGKETLPAPYTRRRDNRGFEAIAYDPEAHVIYAFIQSPLENPNTNAVRNRSDVLRVLGISADNGIPVSEYVLLLERNREPGLSADRVDKIGDAVYAGGGRFYILERDSDTGPNGKKFIFEISLQGATNILGTALARKTTSRNADDKTLEMMTADELAAAGIRPAHKTKLLNLPSVGYLPNDKPEGLTLLPDGSFAVINDNDFGVAGAGISDEISLGIISFDQNYGFDASDRDNGIFIKSHPVLGMYQPDAVVSFEHNGKNYFLTANEGDARDYSGAPGLVEEARVRDIFLNPAPFGRVDSLQLQANLGRLTVTKTQGDLEEDGLFDRLYVLGGRSFSIFDGFGNQVYDSGSDFERITASQYPAQFNSSNDSNNSFDNRSDNKGPEPEAAAVGQIGDRRLAFIGLERIGGIMVYDISDPLNPEFLSYLNNRNFGAPAQSREAGDLGVEDLVFVSAQESPNGAPLLISANEVSGTVSIFSVEDATDISIIEREKLSWRIFPNPAGLEVSSNIISNFEVYSLTGQLLIRAGNTNRIDVQGLPAGTYVLRDTLHQQARLFVKQ